jgi:hypothetical protein
MTNGKAIPVTGRGGPQGYETSRLSHILYNWLTVCGEVVRLTRRPGRAIAQAVRRRLPTAAARVQTRVWSCGIM